MQFLLYALVSVLSGIFAGMGMGGGTFLIPMLSLFFGIEQIYCNIKRKVCQWGIERLGKFFNSQKPRVLT